MRRLTAVVVLVGLAMTMLATGALAASPFRGCPVGPGFNGGSTIGPWQLIDQPTLADALEDSGLDPAGAEVLLANSDKNGDGLICVMIQTLPNSASGGDTFFVNRDNNLP